MTLTISEMVIAARMHGMSYGKYVQELRFGRANLPPIKEIRAQLVKPKKRGARRGEAVNCYDMEGNFLTSYDNAGMAAEHLGGNAHTIQTACNGIHSKSAYGYQWRYASDEAPGVYKRGKPQTPMLTEKITLECQRCGKWYKGVKRSKYCSKECADLAWRDQVKANRERRKKNGEETRVCKFCGKTFPVQGKRLYCSAKCQTQHGSRLQWERTKAQNRK